MRFILTVVAMGMALWGSFAMAQAQQDVWIQIEATPSQSAASARVRAYANEFVDVNGFTLASGWSVIVLGPLSPEAALERMGNLKFERLIPSDSFIADGRNFVARFWPEGDSTVPTAQPEPTVAPTATSAIPAPAPEPVETLADMRRAEQRLTRDERRAIQTALQWFGHYNSGIDGAFGPGSRAAISSWQTATGAEATGVLSTLQRQTLLGEWQQALSAIGLANHVDAEAGIAVDLPLGLVKFDNYAPPFAQFNAINDSGVQVLLISQPGDQSALAGLYEILQSASIMPIDGPRAIRGRGFEIRGANTEIESYAFAEQSGKHIKGYVVSWPLARASDMVPVLAAMKSSFRSTGPQVLDPGLVPLDDAQRSALMVGLAPRRPVVSRSGFFVDDTGLVVTTSQVVDACDRLSIDGGQDMDLVFSDPALGVAVLRPQIPLAPLGHAKLAAALPDTRAEVAVAGFSFEQALSRPVMTFGAFEGPGGPDGTGPLARLSLSALPGDAGGPVIDRNGAVLGVLLPRTQDSTRQLPADMAFVLPAPLLATRLAEAGLRSTAPEPALLPLAPEDMTRLGTNMAVLVSCWR